jgi:hypothetical protein
MKNKSRKMLALLLVLTLPLTVSANSAEPPGMIIIVEDAPEDMTITLELPTPPEYEPRVSRSVKLWETYYRLFYHITHEEFESAALRIESSEGNFTCPLPEGMRNGYNNLLTLNFRTQSLTLGQRWWRQPLLTVLRVTLTLLTEGLVFWFIFDFREKRSWIVFFAVNLVTQLWLNLQVNGYAFSGGYWVILLFFIEAAIFIAESIAFPLLLKEKRGIIRVLYALCANIVSLIAGILLIGHLPI